MNNPKLSATERVIRRSLKNGIKLQPGISATAIDGKSVPAKVLTYERDKDNFMLVLQSDVAGRDLAWPANDRYEEFASYVETIRAKMLEEE